MCVCSFPFTSYPCMLWTCSLQVCEHFTCIFCTHNVHGVIRTIITFILFTLYISVLPRSHNFSGSGQRDSISFKWPHCSWITGLVYCLQHYLAVIWFNLISCSICHIKWTVFRTMHTFDLPFFSEQSDICCFFRFFSFFIFDFLWVVKLLSSALEHMYQILSCLVYRMTCYLHCCHCVDSDIT